MNAGNSSRDELVATIEKRRISAIIRTAEERLASDAMRAAVSGGFRIVEFTLTTPNALGLISDFADDPDLLVGAGTVLSAQQARDAVTAGAGFLVSPIFDRDVVVAAHELGVPMIPGTFTATEMHTAHNHGADFVKLFPAPTCVRDYVTAILGPLPMLRIFPTAGVDADNFVEVLEAGAAGVGFVRSLFAPSDLADRDFAAIEHRALTITSRFAEYAKDRCSPRRGEIASRS